MKNIKFLQGFLIGTITASILIIISTGVLGADVPKDIAAIQRDGHFYYRINNKTSLAVSSGRRPQISNVFHVLPKNSPGSCSHEVAIKIKLLRERIPNLSPLVAIYDMKMKSGLIYPHTVVVIENPEGGFWVLDNKSHYVHEYSDLNGFRNIKVMSYEKAYEIYNRPIMSTNKRPEGNSRCRLK